MDTTRRTPPAAGGRGREVGGNGHDTATLDGAAAAVTLPDGGPTGRLLSFDGTTVPGDRPRSGDSPAQWAGAG